MIYLLVAAALVLVATLALRSSSPTRTFVMAGAGLVVAVSGFFLLVWDGERDPPPTIDPASLVLQALTLSSDRYGQQLKGSVVNGSAMRLGKINLKITYRECPPETACRDIEVESHEIFMALAPKQTGGFSVLLQHGDLSAKTGVAWQATIIAAQADF